MCWECSHHAPRIRFSRHATERYVKRVNPSLSGKQALRVLAASKRTGTFTTERPEWVRAAETSPAYLIVDEATCVPLVPTDDCWFGTTTLTRWNLKRMDDFNRGERVALSDLRSIA